jgi:transposase
MLTKHAKDIRRKLAELFPLLNERQRRLLAAAEARDYGWGGVSVIAEITGLSRQTIYSGLRDLESLDETERVRSVGGGRKRSTESMPELLDTLEEIVGESTRGDPENPLRWTCKSVRKISDTLREQGFEVSHQTVARILHDLEYSLQANRKTSEGVESHPDRDTQFEFIGSLAKRFIKQKCPVISVDPSFVMSDVVNSIGDCFWNFRIWEIVT